MTDQRLEHEIRATLDEAAPPLPPDQLMHSFEQQARKTRRRPRWLAHSTEPPMYYDSSLAVGSPTVRMVSIMAATLMLVLAMVAVGIGISRLLPHEIVVDASGNGDYTTMREALDAARDGTSILVMPGTYSGYLDVSKDVSITGVGDRGEIVIEYDHEGQPGEVWGYGIRLDQVDASITSLEIRGPSDGTAIRALGGTLALEDVAVHPGPFTLWTSGGGVLRDVVSYGLVLDGASGLAVQDSELWCTVRVAGASDITFERSEFLLDPDRCVEEPANEQGDQSIASGPRTAGRDDSTFVLGDPVAFPLAVQVEASAPTFEDNTFGLPLLVHASLVEKAAVGPRYELGVYADPPGVGARPVVEGNTFRGLETAITVFDSATPEIRGNAFIDNDTAVGVARSNTVIENNAVSGGRTAFELTAVNPEVTGNTVEVGTGPAVAITGSAAPILRDNTLCAEGEVLEIADTAAPDIDESNEICETTPDAIVVDGSGGGDFTTLSEAVTAAQDGDHILVRPGTYVEAVVVDKDLTIAGDGDGPVVLTAPEDGPSRESQPIGAVPYALSLEGSTTTVSGLTFRGERSALHVEGGTANLAGLAFEGVGRTNTNGEWFEWGTRFPEAIAMIRDAEVTLADSTFDGGGPIAAHGDTRPTIERNVLRNGPSIHVFLPAEGSVVRGNLITQGSVRGIAVLGGEHGLLIEDNVISDMDGDGIVLGTELSDATNALVRGNEVSDSFTGINVAEGSSPTLADNVVSGNELGIWSSKAAEGLTATGNTLTDNEIGIRVLGGQGLFEANTVAGGTTGIQLVWSADPSIMGNTVERASDVGLSIDSGSSGSVTENGICDNATNLKVAPEREEAIRSSNEVCEDG